MLIWKVVLRGHLVAAAGLLTSLAAFPSSASAHSGSLVTSSAPETTNIACPVDGDSDFFDDWGDPRSGGRRHQGVDMVAPRGTPILAAAAGFAEMTTSNSAGKAIWLTTPGGNKFYYAHLDVWEGESRIVDAGDVVGYVGSTGNAGGPHLHFETHPGGVAENPFPAVDAACRVPATDEAVATGATPSQTWGRRS